MINNTYLETEELTLAPVANEVSSENETVDPLMTPVKLNVSCRSCREKGNPELLPAVTEEIVLKHLGNLQETTLQYIPLYTAETDGIFWFMKLNGPASVSANDRQSGLTYVETANRVLAKTKHGESSVITNATLRVTGVKEFWKSDDVCIHYLCCEIQCAAWKKGKRAHLEIPWTKYKDIYQEIRKNFPDVYVRGEGGALEEYLSDVYNHRKETLPVVREANYSGWSSWKEYVIGKDPFYRMLAIPDISKDNATRLFSFGRQFLAIGRNNSQICTLYLASHLAYTLYWFKKANLTFQSVFFVQGGTGLLKTSVVRVISNVFNTDREKAVIRLNSTSASMQKTITYLRDMVVCVDDFSNTEPRARKQGISAAEEIIRAVGDSSFPSKSDASDYRSVMQNTVRSVVIMTGEEGLELGTSSQLRMIVIPVTKGTFDGESLRFFQQKPRAWAAYTALFLKFLTEKGSWIVSYSEQTFFKYREHYAQQLEDARFIDAAAILRLECDMIAAYARWCQCEETEIQTLSDHMTQSILETMRYTQSRTKAVQPEIQFLQALWNSINATNIAESEEVYAEKESRFIGFYEGDEAVWLQPEAAYQLVRHYYAGINQPWLVGFKRIKEILFEKGISKGKKKPNGQTEYLCRAKKGNRKRMLVLRLQEVQNYLTNLD